MTDDLKDWVIVPREASEAMCATADALAEHTIIAPRVTARAIYEDMILASPVHPAQEAVERLVMESQKASDIIGTIIELSSTPMPSLLAAMNKLDAALTPFMQEKRDDNA